MQEGWQSVDAVMVHLFYGRLIVLFFLICLLMSFAGVTALTPFVLVNTAPVLMPIYTVILALIVVISRAQRLKDFRENMRAKIASEQLRLWDLNHRHLAAMRWSVIGQSAQSLVGQIEKPLQHINQNIVILRNDPRYLLHSARCERLQRCTDRCIDHVKVISTLIEDTQVNTTSLRLDRFVASTLEKIRVDMAFKWQLRSRVRGWVEVDEALLHKVLLQLVDNASRGATSVGRSLELFLVLDRLGSEIILSIQDNGVGIEKGKNVFEPFYSSHAFGLGLGLNVAQRRLNAMGGRIRCVDSENGAKFCIHLPVGTVP